MRATQDTICILVRIWHEITHVCHVTSTQAPGIMGQYLTCWHNNTLLYHKFQDSEFRHNRWQVGCVRKFEYQWRQKQVLLLFRDMFEWFLTNFNIHGISFIQRWIFLLLFTQNQIRFRSPYHEFIKHLYPNDQIQFLLSSCLSISDLVVIFAHLWCCHKKNVVTRCRHQ